MGRIIIDKNIPFQGRIFQGRITTYLDVSVVDLEVDKDDKPEEDREVNDDYKALVLQTCTITNLLIFILTGQFVQNLNSNESEFKLEQLVQLVLASA